VLTVYAVASAGVILWAVRPKKWHWNGGAPMSVISRVTTVLWFWLFPSLLVFSNFFETVTLIGIVDWFVMFAASFYDHNKRRKSRRRYGA
jgi:hypothetical protein